MRTCAQVYHPCILQAKKRYVGFAYEAPGQGAPIFDAKGIETVRRDTCGAVAKMLERCLRILFSTKDLSQVRACTGHACTPVPYMQNVQAQSALGSLAAACSCQC